MAQQKGKETHEWQNNNNKKFTRRELELAVLRPLVSSFRRRTDVNGGHWALTSLFTRHR